MLGYENSYKENYPETLGEKNPNLLDFISTTPISF